MRWYPEIDKYQLNFLDLARDFLFTKSLKAVTLGVKDQMTPEKYFHNAIGTMFADRMRERQ